MNNNHNAVKNIKIAFFLNVFFTIIEFIGGYFTNSIAIMSDALHDLGDSFSLGLAWFLEIFSSKKRTDKLSYGYKRLSLVGALINAIILFSGSVYILTKAIPRIFNPEATNAQGMFLLSIFGIIVNGFAVIKTMKGKTLNEKVISWHLLEDVLGWIAVLITSIVMIFTEITVLDPVLSMLITLYILSGVFKNLKSITFLFLQATPDGFNIETIEKDLKESVDIRGIHDTHIWSLDGEKHILTTHIKINKNSQENEMRKIKCKIKQKLKEIGINHSTLEFEFEDENCGTCCEK